MVIHYTHSYVHNSGELKRMKNIDKDVVDLLGGKSVEIEFYPISKYKYVHREGQYLLSDNVIKKYYVPNMRIFGRIFHIFIFIYVLFKYKPLYIIGEMMMYPEYFVIFRIFNKKCKLIFDIHGAAAEECEYQGMPLDVVEKVRQTEKKSVQKVDYIICQSSEMKEYLCNEYSVPSSKVCVYRCGVDNSLFFINPGKRKEIRALLGFEDKDVVFVYSGGLHSWQRVSESIDIFERYHTINPESKLLVLTGSSNELLTLLKEKMIDNSDNHILTRCLNYNEVPDYLNACDIAFLLRHNHKMNAVASPTKLAEYLACGLPVITSDVAEKWVTKEGLSFFVQEHDPSINDAITSIIRNTSKESIYKYSQDYLSLQVDKKNISDFFENNL